MVDLWEVLGRFVTNDSFRQSLYAIPVGYYPLDPSGAALIIPADRYNTARHMVTLVITDGPVSLMTVGELLLMLSSQKFRVLADDLVAAIKSSNVSTAGRSKLFYTAVGAMILDDSLRNIFYNKGFDAVQFGSLSQPERDDLTTLADPASPVGAKANVACALFWLPRCHDKFNFYTNHVHPLANPLP
jgi:hypothetical protein